MKKKYVCNQNGFLLIEHLIAIFLTGLLTTIIVVLLHLIKGYQVETNQISQHEIETLTTRLQKEASKASSISANQSQLVLHFDNSSNVSYHVQNNRLTRQVNGIGGEIALYHCKMMTIELLNNHSVKLELVSNYDDVFNIYLSTLTSLLLVDTISANKYEIHFQ